MQKDNKSLTVIIPNYNKSSYIKECVESIEKQSLIPNEIVIVDDCSTDNSREAIINLSKEYDNIKYIFLNKNGGVSAARNLGLQMASSEYVTFIDSDDFYINKDKIKNEMEIISKNPSKQTIAYSVTITVDSQGAITNTPFNRKWHRREFVKGECFVMLISTLKQSRVPRDYCVKKDYLCQIGAYSYKKNFYEDLDLVMRLAEGGAIFECTYQPGTAYRQTGNGLSSKTTKEHREERKNICGSYFKKLSFGKKILCSIYRFFAFFKHCFYELRFLLQRH